MLLLMQGGILIEYPISILPSALIKLIFRASRHMVYVSWSKVVIIYEIVAHSSIKMFLGWIQVSL